jgi:hypothetical protein
MFLLSTNHPQRVLDHGLNPSSSNAKAGTLIAKYRQWDAA